MAATQAKDDMVIMTEHLKATLQDWRALVNSFKTCDIGAGGVATPGLNSIMHTVWQLEWPEDIKEMM